MSKVAVIRFPGSNCVRETVAGLKKAGCEPEVLRWNSSEDEFHQYGAYVLPGGFSFQDRVRAGAISAKLPVMRYLAKANAAGKPILGICNGCQILAEAGLVPDSNDDQHLEMALAPNTVNGQAMGHTCDWIHVKVENPGNCVFTAAFSESDILPIQVNHGEGRFVFEQAPKYQDRTIIRYTDSTGTTATAFPNIPNGSTAAIAGISNKKGNVLAMMPHPDRAFLAKQIPDYLDTPWATASTAEDGPFLSLFQSLATHLKESACQNA